MKRKVLWLVYRKLRPALGIPVAFVLMSAAFLGIFNLHLIILALGFLFIDLFGNFYNDYCDFPEDKRNGRKDKFTTSGIMSVKKVMYLSFIFAATGLVALLYVGAPLLLLGGLYTFILFIYSYESVRLKGRVWGYATVAFPFFLLPILIASANFISVINALPLSFFFFIQYTYILCQKDSTDRKDSSNMFIAHGWKKSTKITAIFGASSLASLFMLSIVSLLTIPVLLFSVFLKLANIKRIMAHSITRRVRSRIIFSEFLTHYLFIAATIGGAFL